LKHPDTVLLVFAKAPIAGEVNTRLIPDLGVDMATNLQAELIHSRLKGFKQSGLCDLQLWCSPRIPAMNSFQNVRINTARHFMTSMDGILASGCRMLSRLTLKIINTLY